MKTSREITFGRGTRKGPLLGLLAGCCTKDKTAFRKKVSVEVRALLPRQQLIINILLVLLISSLAARSRVV